MAATITWSVDSHKHETAGKKCVLSASYRVTGVDGDTSDSIYSEVSLDRPSDSDMKDYAEFLGTGNAALVAAVKAKLGAETVTANEDAVKNSKENLKFLVKESQTPKGLNEQGVKELSKAGFYKSLEKTLNSIHRRLNK